MYTATNSQLPIGNIIRQEVLPKGMSVTEAAKRLGVSRPALSNLLNGKAVLSPKMALRLEETFGANMKDLLTLQANAEPEIKKYEHRIVPVSRFVPDFLTIAARQIEMWGSKQNGARVQLAVLVRRLIHATGRELQKVEFPGFDNAERRGFDGQVLASAAALNVPIGESVWQLSVSKNVRKKAEQDYIAGLKQLPNDQQVKQTFVFVTTRNWEGKNNWAKQKNLLGNWKEVRVYDASDLEQWLEITVEPRIWLAEKLDIPTDGFCTIEACWDEWAMVTEPQLLPTIFGPSIRTHKKKFQDWLASRPNRPFVVVSNSPEESTAFIACLLQEINCSSTVPSRAVVFNSVETLKSLGRSTSPFVVVVSNEEVERSIADLYKHRHCIIVRPRNVLSSEMAISIDSLDRSAFERALIDMGIEQERVDKLGYESGWSPTVLRRRLSEIPAIRTPPWAKKSKIGRKIIPMALAGSWHAEFEADSQILAELSSDTCYSVESEIAELNQIADCPIWRIGKHYGVVSKIDAIFATAPFMTERNLGSFFVVAEHILSKADPVIDFPEKTRWGAEVFEKISEHSAVLRRGIRDTLVFLAVHGDILFSDRLDVKGQVSALVRRLLTPLTSEKLMFHRDDLPDFAEAAPSEFLDILRREIRQKKSVLPPLIKSTGQELFAITPLPGLLWALERLAWYPEHLINVVDILAELSRIRINDNWASKPAKSLASIFHSWFPQTAAPVDARTQVLEHLCKHFPDIGWQICISQVDGSNSIAEYSARPRWRAITSGIVTSEVQNDRRKFERTAFDLMLDWPNHDTKTLEDLLRCLWWLSEKEQGRVLDSVSKWIKIESHENNIAEIREEIGRILSRIDADPRDLCPENLARLQEIFHRLTPRAPFKRLALPFNDYWNYFPVVKAEDPSLDQSDWPTRYHEICKQAMAEILSSYGVNGVLKLLKENNSGFTIGRYMAYQQCTPQSVADTIIACLSTDQLVDEKIDEFTRGLFERLGDDMCDKVLSLLLPSITDEDILRIFGCLEFTVQTWNFIDKLPNNFHDRYWENVRVPLKKFSTEEIKILVDNLLDVGRSYDAFVGLRHDWDRVEAPLLRRLLTEITDKDRDRIIYSGDVSYYMSRALSSLSRRSDVSVDEMAQLEFATIEFIDRRERNVPYLEKQIEEFPSKFIEILNIVSQPKIVGQSSPEEYAEVQIRQRILVSRAYALLRALSRLPGEDDQGNVRADILNRWVTEARRLALQHECVESFDVYLGQWLSMASSQEDTPWPKLTICEVLEKIASENIASGFRVGVYNARGVTVRRPYEGGRQEREIAEKYENRAEFWRYKFPFVSNVIRQIATRYTEDADREDRDAQIRQRCDL